MLAMLFESWHVRVERDEHERVLAGWALELGNLYFAAPSWPF